jgi:hypothetical protein
MRTIKNRKTANKEIERQKKQKRHLIALIAVAVSCMVVAAISWVVWDVQSRGWIIRFEGERISTNELRFFMPDDSPQGKQAGLNVLLESLAIIHRADMHGVNLSDEEHEMWTAWVEMTMGNELFYISAERLAEFYAARFGEVWEQLMDIYVPESLVFVDEYAFEMEFAEYLEENRDLYMQMDLKYVMIDDPETAEAVHAQLLAGEIDFDDAIREHNPWYTEEEGIVTMPLQTFVQEAGLTIEQTDALIELQVGDVSEIIEWGVEFGMLSHLIVYVETREEPDEAEVKAGFRNRQIMEKRNEMMLGLVPQWVTQANYTLNQRAMNHA